MPILYKSTDHKCPELVEVDSTLPPISDDIKKKIDENWEALLEIAKELRQEVYDGELFRYEGCIGGKVFVSKIPYKVLQGLKFLVRSGEEGLSYHPKGMAVSGLITASDGWVGMGKRRLTEKRPVDFFGGVFETKYEYPISCLRQELSEEAGVRAEDVDRCVFLGLYETMSGTVCFLFQVYLKHNKEETSEYFQKRSDNEMKDITFIQPEEFPRYLQELGEHFPDVAELL